ncbi:hypothetical protein PBRA_002585 [Plasmodiophora brassicae]|uniref:PA domain-containing protein n=1 Tax=Plasmodiophora brassicae TaxID=37360 RepID=A0A0G4J4V8_PLABS|nr:hypothetical protein PBRA_002585 [Plasmodiophora brassicae]
MLCSTCLFFIATVTAVHGTVTFSAVGNSALGGASVYSPTMSVFAGPQPNDHVSVTAPGDVFSGDVCRPLRPLSYEGKVVFIRLQTMPCTMETMYTNLIASGAVAAIVIRTGVTPNSNMYQHDGSRGGLTRNLPMLFLVISPPESISRAIVQAAARLGDVAAFPDENVWSLTYSSWYYQLLVRVLPSVIAIAAGALAGMFLLWHCRGIVRQYHQKVPCSSRSVTRFVRFISKNVSYVHFVLAIEFVTSTLLGAVIAIGGNWSTPGLSAQVSNYFGLWLSGWGWACAVMATMFWSRMLEEAAPRASAPLMYRVFRGDFALVTAILCIAPIVFENVLSALCVVDCSSSSLLNIGGLFGVTVQLLISYHLLVTVYLFHKEASRVTNAVSCSSSQVSMFAFLRRLSSCALGVAVASMLCVVAISMLTISYSFLHTPTGWTVIWGLGLNGRALDAAFQVLLFKPRDMGMPGCR